MSAHEKSHNTSNDNLKKTSEAQIRSYSRKRNLDSLIKTTNLPKSKNYRKVEPRLLFQTAKEDLINKKSMKEEVKAQRELEGCTFQPALNTKSLAMARNNPKPPIGLREVPERYRRAIVEELYSKIMNKRLDAESATMVLPKSVGKKPNNEFYSQKVAWRKAANEKIETHRRKKSEDETNTFIGKPKIIDYSNHKIVPKEKLDNDQFLDRVQKTLKKKEDKVKSLSDQMYCFPFKPALYKPRRTGEINGAS